MLARLKAILVDLERLDLRLHRGSRNTQFGSCARGPVHPSSAFAEGRLDDGLLLRRRPSQNVEPTVLLGCDRLSRQPTLIDGETLGFTHDNRSLNHVLQFANIARPGVRLKQIEAPFG